MRTGLSRINYPERRCIIDGNSESHFVNMRWYNSYTYRNIIRTKLLKKGNVNVFSTLIEPYRLDNIITFNDVCMTHLPWVCIFETMVPRHPVIIDFHRKLVPHVHPKDKKIVSSFLKCIALDNCISINALSQNAAKIQRELLSFFPDIQSEISKKIKVTHAPQHILESYQNIKNYQDKLNFIYIGRDFYRKGGGEIILSFKKLLEEKKLKPNDFMIYIIGDVNKKDNYVHEGFTDKQAFYSEVENFIKTSSSVCFYPEVENKRVLDIMSKCHIGLLPTWGDTYGYSMLEMQAAGLPVISTNVRALPEINYSGLIIDVANNELGEICISEMKDKELFREKIIFGLKQNIMSLFCDRGLIMRGKENAIAGVRSNHDPSHYFDELRTLFNT